VGSSCFSFVCVVGTRQCPASRAGPCSHPRPASKQLSLGCDSSRPGPTGCCRPRPIPFLPAVSSIPSSPGLTGVASPRCVGRSRCLVARHRGYLFGALSLVLNLPDRYPVLRYSVQPLCTPSCTLSTLLDPRVCAGIRVHRNSQRRSLCAWTAHGQWTSGPTRGTVTP